MKDPIMIGNKNRFAAVIEAPGDPPEKDRERRCVHLWAGLHQLTADSGEKTEVQAFCRSVRSTLDLLQSDCEIKPPNGFSPIKMHHALRKMEKEMESERNIEDLYGPYRHPFDPEGFSLLSPPEKYLFPQWGPSTREAIGHLFRYSDRVFITFEFVPGHHAGGANDGKVFAVDLPVSEFIRLLEQMLTALDGSAHAKGAA